MGWSQCRSQWNCSFAFQKKGSMSGRPEIRNKGNSSQESAAAAEIPAARSVQEVLAGGGFSALLSQQPEVGSIQWEIREDERGSIIQEKREEKSRFERLYMWQKQSWSQQLDRPGRIRSLNWGQLILTSACYNNFRLD